MSKHAMDQLLAEAPGLSLAYHAGRHASIQWRAFVAALARTLYDNAEDSDADAFLREVGTNMARALPLPQVATLEELEAAMNAKWADLDWGWVRLREGAGDVGIVHGATPTSFPEDTSGSWVRASVPLLEGLYAEWFAAQQGPAHLGVSLVGERAEPLHLRYGR